MIADLADLKRLGRERAIALAKDGDGSLLAEIVRHAGKKGEPLDPEIWRYLANLLDGKERWKQRKKISEVARQDRYIQMSSIRMTVGLLMHREGRRRDKHLRTALISQVCDYHGVTAAEYERFLHQQKSRRK